MINEDKNLRKLQLIELKISLEFKRICDKHYIQYFLIGGTFLGAFDYASSCHLSRKIHKFKLVIHNLICLIKNAPKMDILSIPQSLEKYGYINSVDDALKLATLLHKTGDTTCRQ
jgi:hypothetical protein